MSWLIRQHPIYLISWLCKQWDSEAAYYVLEHMPYIQWHKWTVVIWDAPQNSDRCQDHVHYVNTPHSIGTSTMFVQLPINLKSIKKEDLYPRVNNAR